MTTSLVSYKLGKRLSSIYQDESLHFENELQPVSRRVDIKNSMSPQLASDQFRYDDTKRFFELMIKKTEQYTVTLRDTTVKPNDNPTVMTAPAILNKENFFPTNFGISKSISRLRIQTGSTDMEETSDERNPWLIEAKSAQFHMAECEAEGQHPLIDSGIGNFNCFMGNGNVRGVDIATVVTAPENLYPLKNPSVQTFSEFAKVMANAKKRWRIVGIPQFKKASNNSALTASQSVYGSNEYDWVPYETYVPVAPDTNTTRIFWGEYIGTYVIEVSEYIIGKFLTTPYQGSKFARSISVSPNNGIQIFIDYDTNYINNGLFNWNSNQTTLGGLAYSTSPPSATTSYMSVARIPSASTIEVRSFDALRPPYEGATFKMLNWKPVRCLDASPFSLTNNGSGRDSFNVVVNYNQDARIAKYILISALPELWNGSLNSVLTNNLMAPYNVSKFMPAKITACRIENGQENLTEFIPMSELIEISQSLLTNKELMEQIGFEKIYTLYQTVGIKPVELGVPFLLLDTEKLCMRSDRFRQYMANVQYPIIQNMKISYTVTSRNFNPAGYNPGTLLLTNEITYTPHVYMFYPHVAIQHLNGTFENNALTWDLETAERAIDLTHRADGHRSLTLTGGGWFDDIKDYLKDNYKNLLKHVVSGVRYGEEQTRDNENWKHVNQALKIASDGAKYFGYGKRSGAVANLR